MKGNLLIVLNVEDENSIELSPYFCDDEYLVTLYINDSVSYEYIIGNDEYFEQMIFNFELMYKDDYPQNKKLIELIDEDRSSIKEFLHNFKSLSISGSIDDVKEYIEENEIFLGKDILYNGVLSLRRETYEDIVKCFGEDTRLKFLIEGNNAPITIDDYKKTIEKIESIAYSVRSFNLSPLEEIMIVYDFVRDRQYIAEGEEEEYTVSRDLTSVLFGNKIVCAGFAVLFNAILNCLGYRTMPFKLLPTEGFEAHMRSLVYVEDEKYDIKGMYFFDTTYECKKDDNSFLNKYKYFARTYEQMNNFDRGKLYNELYKYMNYDDITDLEVSLNEDYVSFLDLIKKVDVSKLNKLMRFCNLEEIPIGDNNISKEDLIDRICEIPMLSNNNINYEIFIGVLYNARKQQYYSNPEKYAFDMDVITDILVKSSITDKADNARDRFVMALFGASCVVGRYSAPLKVDKYFKEQGLDKDMERIKLARILKTILEQKEKDEKRLTFKN